MVVAKLKLSYEECRRKRVEENKKGMEALNLPQLSQALRTPSFKPSPKKQVKPRTVGQQLAVVYKEGLPGYFCRRNLPKPDEVMTLIDEDHEYPTIFLARKTGPSGGWKGFTVAHELVVSSTYSI